MTTKTFIQKICCRYVVLNLIAMAVVCTALVYAAMFCADIYTHHGEAIAVPDIRNKKFADAERLLEDAGLVLVVNDTSYNRLLPPDVAVQAVRPVGPEMHARFSATRRTYHYYIHTRKDPFLRGYSWQVNVPLDFALMNEAAQVLLEYSDFTSFSKTGTDVKTNICQLTEARWEQLKPGEWRFTVSANRFLRNMVRAIVGTLVEVGRHRMTISQMRHAIEAKDRQRAGESVPGHALYLTNIEY
ncbi:MAG: tRNA pseudouridine(38-40) synthase TruA [Prevotella sp.]|nr:tRNA pseudouridine(38-40) synthase TruA [Prevotella sp.]